MREIKFRGKRVDGGEWVYGDYSSLNEYDRKPHPAIWINSITDYKIIPESVGQYTGLKDKNGKEIYEGDILKAWKHNETEFMSTVRHYRGVLWFLNWNWSEFQNIFRNIEVIGNIYENPSFLEVSQ